MESFLDRLKRRKLFQWVLAYIAGAWLAIQVLDVIAEPWGLAAGFVRSAQALVALGFFLVLVLAWYHGEKGRQRVSGPELLMIGGLLALTGLLVTVLERSSDGLTPPPESAPAVMALKQRDRPAVAVLPFANLSADEENEFFTLGIHDDILTQLSKISALDVIARTSVMQYADTDKSISEIGRELGVLAVVEGGVQRVGSRIRINVQLIQADSDMHLWAETYDRDLSAENIFAIQSEIAQQIAESLRATLTPEEGSRIARAATTSVSAYDFFLRGREAYARYTRENNAEAIRLFREALELDSAYARAWAGLGDAFAQQASTFGLPLTWVDSAMVASRQALEIDPLLADGHKALGLAYLTRGEYTEALTHFLRAIDLDPSYYTAVGNAGIIYFRRGLFGEYHRWVIRAFRLAPNFYQNRTQVAWSYWQLEEYDLAERWARDAVALRAGDQGALMVLVAVANQLGDFEAALELAERLVETSPTSASAQLALAWTAMIAGDFDRARPALEEAMRLNPSGLTFHHHYLVTTLGYTLLQTGDAERGLQVLAEAERSMLALMERDESWAPVWELAAIHAARGETEEAIRWAEQAYESRGYRFPDLIALVPIFDSVRDDERFQAIIARMKADVAEMRGRVEEQDRAVGFR